MHKNCLLFNPARKYFPILIYGFIKLYLSCNKLIQNSFFQTGMKLDNNELWILKINFRLRKQLCLKLNIWKLFICIEFFFILYLPLIIIQTAAIHKIKLILLFINKYLKFSLFLIRLFPSKASILLFLFEQISQAQYLHNDICTLFGSVYNNYDR